MLGRIERDGDDIGLHTDEAWKRFEQYTYSGRGYDMGPYKISDENLHFDPSKLDQDIATLISFLGQDYMQNFDNPNHALSLARYLAGRCGNAIQDCINHAEIERVEQIRELRLRAENHELAFELGEKLKKTNTLK